MKRERERERREQGGRAEDRDRELTATEVHLFDSGGLAWYEFPALAFLDAPKFKFYRQQAEVTPENQAHPQMDPSIRGMREVLASSAAFLGCLLSPF